MSSPTNSPGRPLTGLERLRVGSDLVTTFAVLVATGFVIWVNWPRKSQEIELPAEPIKLENVALRGRPDAPVVLVEFSDFECPFCGRFARETLPALEDQYVKSGLVRVGFRHLPLDRLHPQARVAAAASICAGRQGRFWEMHDLLFSDQKQMTRSSLVARAKSLSVDTKAFEACLADDTVARQIQDDEAFARTLNITGTPALLVGKSLEDGRVEFVAALRGAVPFDELQKKIDAALNTRRLSPLWLAGGGLVIVAFLGGRMYQRARKRSSSEPIQ